MNDIDIGQICSVLDQSKQTHVAAVAVDGYVIRRLRDVRGEAYQIASNAESLKKFFWDHFFYWAFLLFPPNFSWCTLYTRDDYFLVAGTEQFIVDVWGHGPRIFQDSFFDYNNLDLNALQARQVGSIDAWMLRNVFDSSRFISKAVWASAAGRPGPAGR